MKSSSMAQGAALNAPMPREITPEDRNALPPTAAIDANKKLMGDAAVFFGEAMKACRTGFNIVVNGSNPGVARPPERISGINGGTLAALGLAGGMAATNGGAKPQESAKPTGPAPNAAAPAQQGPKIPGNPQPSGNPPHQKIQEKPPSVAQAKPPVAAAPAPKAPKISGPLAKTITLPPVHIDNTPEEDFEP